jgi:hypothetical protein
MFCRKAIEQAVESVRGGMFKKIGLCLPLDEGARESSFEDWRIQACHLLMGDKSFLFLADVDGDQFIGKARSRQLEIQVLLGIENDLREAWSFLWRSDVGFTVWPVDDYGGWGRFGRFWL